MERTARAAVYEAPNEPFRIVTFPLRPVRPREALVRVRLSTICRSDIHSYLGHRPNPCPGILGHEIVGTIEELGEGLEADLRAAPLSAGDRVTWTLFCGEGDPYYREVHDLPQKARGLRKYGHDLASADPHFLGGFAEYCYLLPGTGILKLPEAVSDEEAAPLNCGVATMIAASEAAGIGLGDSVVVQGLGLLGLYGCAIARARGARRVIGLDSVPARLELARRFGADMTLDVSALSPEEQTAALREACPPDGADRAIEVCGVAEAVPAGLAALRVGGVYVIAGLVNPGAMLALDGNELLRRLITLKGLHNYHPRHLVQALDFLLENRARFPFAELVEARFPLEALDEAFARAADRSVLRAAVAP